MIYYLMSLTDNYIIIIFEVVFQSKAAFTNGTFERHKFVSTFVSPLFL